MALIGDNMQSAPVPADAAQGAPQAAPQGGDPVQRIITAAVMLLNTDQVEQHVLELVKSAQDPAQGVAQAFVFILRALHDKSKGMPMQALGQAGKQILEEILKIVEAAHIVQMTPQFLQQAMQAVKSVLAPQQAQQQPATPAPQPAAQPAPVAQQQGV